MTKQRKTKQAMVGLLNWPPSRGPMPAWMKARPTYEVPDVLVEKIEFVQDADGDRRPATPIKRVPTKERTSKRQTLVPSGKTKAGKTKYRSKTEKVTYMPKREWKLGLNHHVDTCASLKPEQWELVGGAELVSACAKKSREAYARCETYLDDNVTLVFDLSYPLSAFARVTIRPYQYVSGRGTKRNRMSVGYVLWQLARAYRKIYRQHKAYGVWGHAIGDLCFERLRIEDNVGDVDIGS